MNIGNIGLLGEWKAERYLKKQGMRILQKRYRAPRGEIDLIAMDGRTLVFVEVKLRKSARYAQAREYVDARKQDKLRVTASIYLSQNPTHLQPRFDIIEIYAPEGTATVSPEIYHLEDAFQ